MENQNIRIHLKAYDNKILDLSTEEIVNTAKEPELRWRDQFLFQQELKDILFKITTYWQKK